MSELFPAENSLWSAEKLAKNVWQISKAERDAFLRLATEPASGKIALANLAGRAEAEIEDGSGFVLLRGFPLDVIEPEKTGTALRQFSEMLGRPVSQNKEGDQVVRVEDVGVDASNRRGRGYQSDITLPLHSDRCDIIVMGCVRPAEEGGLSSVVNVTFAVERLFAMDPDIVRRLFRPFIFDRRGEESAGQNPYLSLPILSCLEGKLVCRYVRRFIESATQLESVPPLENTDINVLNAFDKALNQIECRYDFQMQPGDVQILNNYTVLHSRTAFWDTNPLKSRLLLRIWLAGKRSRRLPPEFLPLYGNIEPGTLRGGVRIFT